MITDLTGYIQTGDLLCNIESKLVLAEVKEGGRNHEILEILSEVKTFNVQLEEIEEKYNLDKKSFKQLKRQAKQMETMSNFIEILNTDQGIDSSSGLPLNIITPKEPTHFYTDRLEALKAQLDSRNLWAYDVIDKCLHIGIYKDHFRHIGPFILKSIGDSKNCIIVNYLQVLDSLNRPLLYLPFEKEFLFDIMFGRVSILFMIDIDKFMELYDEYGLKATWGSRKETMKTIEAVQMKGIFIYKNRGIKITSNSSKEEMWLFHGTFLRIFFETIYPTYIAYSANYNFGNGANKTDS